MNSDDEIIIGCLKGDRLCQDKLYNRFAAAMFGICQRYAGDYDEASDLLQEGFIKVFAKLGSYSGKGSFEGWIKRIFVNNALDHCRYKTRHNLFTPLDDEHDDYNEEPDAPMEISTDKLMEFIQQLPPGYRMVFNLYAIEERSHKEIAESLGVSESTSKTQLLKARKWLQKKVKDYIKVTETI
jgi:RNA polymerase sigma factor (sigma-70 family)